MKERLLALIGAIALIVVAIVARGVLAGDDESAATDDGGGGGRRPVVACSPGVQAVCSALAAEDLIAVDPPTIDLGSPGATTGTIDDVALDAWITWDPAGDIANFDARQGAVWGDPVAVGSAPLVLGSRSGFSDACRADTASWSCTVDGDDAVAIGNPTTIDGLVRALPIASALDPEGDFANAGAIEDLDRLYRRRPAGVGTMTAELRTGVQPGFFQMIVATDPGARGRGYDVITPNEPAAMSLVVTPRSGASTDWVAVAFARPSVHDAVRAVGVDPEQTTLDGSPDAGALYALRERLTG